MRPGDTSYPALRLTDGSDEGRRIPLFTGLSLVYSAAAHAPVEVGSQVRGPGRLEAPGVAPHHATFHFLPLDASEEEWGIFAEPVDGAVAVDGDPDPIDPVKPGAEVALGECKLVMEIVDRLPPAVQAYKEAVQQAASGGRPFRSYVQFKPEDGDKGVGLLSAGGGVLRLVDREGQAVFEVPLAGLGDASFPRHRSMVIKLEAERKSYKIWLIEEAWIADRPDPSRRGDIDTLQTDSPAGIEPGVSSDPLLARDIAAALSLLGDALTQLENRLDRHKWKQILTGEKEPEEISKSTAEDRVSSLGLAEQPAG